MMSGYVDLWELLLEPFVDSIGSRQEASLFLSGYKSLDWNNSPGEVRGSRAFRENWSAGL